MTPRGWLILFRPPNTRLNAALDGLPAARLLLRSPTEEKRHATRGEGLEISSHGLSFRCIETLLHRFLGGKTQFNDEVIRGLPRRGSNHAVHNYVLNVGEGLEQQAVGLVEVRIERRHIERDTEQD